MQWFADWWNGMGMLQQIFACVALPATVLLVLQTILLIFGIGGGHDADHGDFDDHSALTDAHDGDAHDLPGHEPDHDHDPSHSGSGLRIFTIRGFVAFFAVGGWRGIAMLDLGRSPLSAIAAALLGGIVALFTAAFIIKWSLKMQESGTLSIENAISKTGNCYITIPPKRSGSGKVTVTVQEQFTELDAITDAVEPIRPGTQILVIGIDGESTLVVTPLASHESI